MSLHNLKVFLYSFALSFLIAFSCVGKPEETPKKPLVLGLHNTPKGPEWIEKHSCTKTVTEGLDNLHNAFGEEIVFVSEYDRANEQVIMTYNRKTKTFTVLVVVGHALCQVAGGITDLDFRILRQFES